MSNHIENIFTAVLIQKIDSFERLNPCICPFPTSFGVCFNPCEQDNTYMLLQSDPDFDNFGQKIFEFKEKSSFFSKFCFLPSMRESEISGSNPYNDVLISMEKPCKFSLFCAGRPEIIVSYKNNKIGKIYEPFSFQACRCLFGEIFVLDRNGAITYKIKALCCQCGIFCFCPFQTCKNICFDVLNKQDEKVGRITHFFHSWFGEYCSKADKYGIEFPKFATVEEKILLVSTVIFIDFIMFENV